MTKDKKKSKEPAPGRITTRSQLKEHKPPSEEVPEKVKKSRKPRGENPKKKVKLCESIDNSPPVTNNPQMNEYLSFFYKNSIHDNLHFLNDISMMEMEQNSKFDGIIENLSSLGILALFFYF